MAASTLTCCSLVALLAGGPAASEYQGPDYAKLKALLSPGQDAASCYARRYSAEHLKQHPKQKVTEMMLFLRYVTLGEDDAILISTDNGDTSKQYFRYDFRRSMRAETAPRPKGSAAESIATAAGSRSSLSPARTAAGTHPYDAWLQRRPRDRPRRRRRRQAVQADPNLGDALPIHASRRREVTLTFH